MERFKLVTAVHLILIEDKKILLQKDIIQDVKMGIIVLLQVT